MSAAPLITISLIAVNVAIFIVTAALGALRSVDAIIAVGALSRSHVVHGEVWRLVSAMFLHGGVGHIVGNAVGLYIVGMATEHAYGRAGFAGIYFLSGLLGAIFSILAKPGPSVGASGAIFGLLGAMIIFFARYHQHFHLRDKRVGNVLLAWAAYSMVTAQFMPLIDNAAHVGGMLGGALAAFWITPRIISD